MKAVPVTVLAIDPGREKWGLAVVEDTGACLHREVASDSEAPDQVKDLLASYPVSESLLGDRTGSGAARQRLDPLPVPLRVVPEHGTTLLARELYWRDHPPSGWRRLLPRGLLVPPGPLDGYAAEALALRYFQLLKEG
ncbi:MAG: pre-16S rRNA-processing nuclease YqgF [Armatimonadetes bacterium]|nr:pre-16S rRNA-processing nuclease YqgF [Armatimonadota bacterium]